MSEDILGPFMTGGGKIGVVQAVQQRVDTLIRQAAGGIAVFGDPSDGEALTAIPSRGRWVLFTRPVAAASLMAPVPGVPCQAHPTINPPPATHSYTQGLRALQVRRVDPDTGQHLSDGVVDVSVQDAAYICDQCFAFTQHPYVQRKMSELVAHLHDPERFVAVCEHIILGWDRSQALACGECADGGLRCDRCAAEHGFACHVRGDDFSGCAVCRGRLFVPRLFPVGRLDRTVEGERGKPTVHFRGWVWASLRPPKRCAAHVIPPGVV